MKKLLVLFVLAGYAMSVFAQTLVVVNTPITTNTTWTKDKTYLLQGFVYVKNNATLTIEAGTVIKGDKTSKGSLIVTRGAKIMAEGTTSSPIVFTSNEPNPTYGDWGGIILLGKSPTNTAYKGTDGLGEVEGGVNNATDDGVYGGTDPNDNSGILRYVRIEYPGIAFQPNSEINGLTMAGVGAGTTVEYVQVSYSGDDSFEWFGGTVNCKYLIAYRGLDDDFDCDFGYSGNVQFAFAVRDPQTADASRSNGFEVDNDATGSTRTPKTKPTFSNVTIVGPTAPANNLYGRAAHLRRNTEISIFNSVLLGSYPVGVLIDGANTTSNALNGTLEIKNSFVAGATKLLDTVTNNSFKITEWYRMPAFGNQLALASANARLQDPFNLDSPNLRPTFNSPVLHAASFTASRVNTDFFEKVNYIGAFGPNAVNDWTRGWAFFKELNVQGVTPTKDAAQYVQSVQLAPTVTSNSTQLVLTLTATVPVRISIFGSNGQYFGQAIREQGVVGTQRYTLNVQQLPTGLYFVHVQAGETTTSKQLIVVR